MWEIKDIEDYARNRLIGLQEKGESLFADYAHVRQIVVDDIAPEIKRIEPFLTDHGPDHIAAVFDNVAKLLEEEIEEFSPYELYILLLAVQLHDVGNIFGRKDHQKNVSKLYDIIKGKDITNLPEKYLITQVVAAHCGKSQNGSNDTLSDVPEIASFRGQKIRLREIASIVRFADELAEGPGRTSLVMEELYGYPPDSAIHHKYSQITDILVDRARGLVALTYGIYIESRSGKLSKVKEDDLKELLDYTYKRIFKLNEERKYAKHYCAALLPFKETSVGFHFWTDHHKVDLNLKEMRLTDLVVPGETQYSCPGPIEYEVPNIIKQIQSSLRRKSKP